MPKRVTASSHRSFAALPLPGLLSLALVAFTIEFDNEFEHRVVHRTTLGSPQNISVEKTRPTHALKKAGAAKAGSTQAPWLVSLALWALFLRFVPEGGITVRDMRHATGLDKTALRQWLVRLSRWWGYLTIAPDLTAGAVMPSPGDWIIRPTAGGLAAQKVWRSLFAVIEHRWRERFGSRNIDKLRAALAAIANQIDAALPEYLPILGYGLRAHLGRYATTPLRGDVATQERNLPALLAQVLLAFTIDFERESELSLAICANVIRVMDDEGAKMRDLPRLSGVSAEAIKMALGFLSKGAYITIAAESPASRTKVVRLTAKGLLAQDAYRKRLAAIETRWQQHFGAQKIQSLRAVLKQLAGDGTAAGSPLFNGLEPYPDGWRAVSAPRETLPHYPMVLHRGGYPDGA